MTVEELQIIISAKTEGVRAKIDQLKEKIASVQPKKAADVNVTTGKAQGNLKKLQAEIDRTQAKIHKLNAQMADAYAKQDAIVGKYSGVPNLTGMSHDQTLDVMVGQDPKMQELNAQIGELEAKMAPLQARLSETKAQIAAVGNAAEPAAAKTRALGESMKQAGNRMQTAGSHASYFGRMTSRMLLSMMLYQGVSMVFKSISEGVQDMALGGTQANSTMSQLASSALYLKNSLAAALMPALQAVTPVINQAADALANVFNAIAMLNARIFNHSSTVTIAQRANVNYAATLDKAGASADATKQKVKDLQRTVMGFDELNTLQKPAAESAAATPKNANPGMPAAGTMFQNVKVPDWVEKVGEITDKIKKMIQTNVDSIQRILRLTPLVVGAVLAFSGINIPLGIGLMAVGAVLMGKQVKEDWNYLTSKTTTSLDKIQKGLAIAGAVELALGAIFAFSGANVGLGVALMIGGIATTGATLNWDSMGTQIQKSISGISFAAAVAMLALGAILTFSGVGVPIGIGLLIGGATTMWASKTLNWDSMDTQLKATLTKVTMRVGTFLLALGALLTFTGANIPLGTGLMAAGAIGLASAAALNWNVVESKVKDVLSSILAIISASSAVIGLLLCLTGAGIPLGIGLILAGMAGVHKAASISTNPITAWAKSVVNGVIDIFEKGVNFIISMLDKIHWDIPSYVPLVGGKSFGFSIQSVHIPRLATGGLITGPTYSLIGEGQDNEAVLPLNDDVYERIGKGVAESRSPTGASSDVDRIIGRLDRMETAIRDMKVILYSSDQKIAESANRGNRQIDRLYHPIAQT